MADLDRPRKIAPFKKCARCELTKPSSDFHKRSGRRSGLQSACIACKRLERLARPQDKVRSKAYYLENRDFILEQSAEWLAANQDRKKATNKAWYESNSERLAVERAEGADERRVYDALYYAENKDRRAEKNKAWRIANIERVYARNAARRALKRGAGGTHSAADIDHLLKVQNFRCAHSWCRVSLKPGFHRDHVIPLALGGTNDRQNIQLLCIPCNLKKNAQHPIDFARRNGMLL